MHMIYTCMLILLRDVAKFGRLISPLFIVLQSPLNNQINPKLVCIQYHFEGYRYPNISHHSIYEYTPVISKIWIEYTNIQHHAKQWINCQPNIYLSDKYLPSLPHGYIFWYLCRYCICNKSKVSAHVNPFFSGTSRYHCTNKARYQYSVLVSTCIHSSAHASTT